MIHDNTLPWILLVAYMLAIVALTLWNRRKATTMQSFSVGSRQVPAVLVGLSLAANMTSAATFVINPGLVYAYGWAGVVGYGIAAPPGIFLGLVVTTTQFRRIGDRYTALTVPQWVGERYGDRRLTVFFAFISLLQITFLVLIVAALVVVLMSVLGLSVLVALTAVILFTFAYMYFGGASVHIWSNSVQAAAMMAVAVILLASGAAAFEGGFGAFFERLGAIAPHYGSMTNPDSLLFRDLFEVVVANFIIGVAIIMQPHIMSKALYLRSERDVRKYLATAIIVGTLFTAVLLVGLFARLDLGAGLAPDRVVATYILEQFSSGLRAFVMLGILAAGFSTMEGVILALSTIFANDFYANLRRSFGIDEERLRGQLLRVGKLFMILLAPVTFVLAYRQIVNPSLSVAIFAQNGIYGLFAATFAPVVFGMFSARVTGRLAFTASMAALVVHFGMYYGKISPYHNNPAVPAACALVVSVLVVGIGLLVSKGQRPEVGA